MKKLDTKIEAKDIEIKIDPNNQDAFEKVKQAWGPLIPIVQINDYVIDFSELTQYNLTVSANKLPTFNLTINDTNYNIRNTLKEQYIDEITIRVGNDDWYRKYTGIITNAYSNAGSEVITIYGYMFVSGLYRTEQKSYTNISLTDILTNICEDIGLGLYIFENSSTSKNLIKVINPNQKIIDFISNTLIEKYSDCIWAIDELGFLHVGNVDEMRKQPIDTYTIKRNHTFPQPQPIVLTSRYFDDDRNPDPEYVEPKLKMKSFTINTNNGLSVINNYENYYLHGSNDDRISLYNQKVNKPVGIGELTENTFSGFITKVQNSREIYRSMANKSINGKVIDIIMEDILIEVIPFMLVDVEIYLPPFNDIEKYNSDTPDEENSGKKIIIGYSMVYQRGESENYNPYISQTISVI